MNLICRREEMRLISSGYNSVSVYKAQQIVTTNYLLNVTCVLRSVVLNSGVLGVEWFWTWERAGFYSVRGSQLTAFSHILPQPYKGLRQCAIEFPLATESHATGMSAARQETIWRLLVASQSSWVASGAQTMVQKNSNYFLIWIPLIERNTCFTSKNIQTNYSHLMRYNESVILWFSRHDNIDIRLEEKNQLRVLEIRRDNPILNRLKGYRNVFPIYKSSPCLSV